jgi:mannan endo-1,4-beta-mannosidase
VSGILRFRRARARLGAVKAVVGNLYPAGYADMLGPDLSVYLETPHGSGAVPSFDSTWFDAGTQSLRLTAGSNASNDAGQAFRTVPAAAGANLRFSVAVRRGAGTTAAQVSVKWRTAAGALIFETVLGSVTTTVGNVTRINSTQTAPTNSAVAQLVVRWVGAVPSAGQYLQVDSLYAEYAVGNPNTGALGGTIAPRATPGVYSISGTRLLKDGQPFKLVGANIGVSSAIGGNYTSNEAVSAHTAEAIEWGWNAVRLTVYVSNNTQWIAQYGRDKALADIFSATDKYLAAGFVVILAAMDQTSGLQDPNADTLNDIENFFTQAAGRYVNDSRVWVNVNEPSGLYNASTWQTFQSRLYGAVRAMGNSSIYVADILTNSQDGRYTNQTRAYDPTLGPAFLSNAGGTPRTNVLFSLHNYGGQVENDWGQPLSNSTYNDWASKMNAAGLAYITGETGFPQSTSSTDYQRKLKGFTAALQQTGSNGVLVWDGTDVDDNTLKASMQTQYRGQVFWYHGSPNELSVMGLMWWNWCHAYVAPDPLPTGSTTVPTRQRLTKTSAGQLQVGGQPFRFAGPNIYWLALNDNATGGTGSFVSDADIKLALDQAVAMNATGARVHTVGISVGKTNTMMPTLGTWNDAAVERADFVVYEASKRNLKLVVPTTDRWDFYHGGLLTLARMVLGSSATLNDAYTNTQVLTAYKAYLSTLLNHVNRYSGIRWGDDPTLASWEIANEAYDMPAAFHAAVAAHLKSLAPLALTMDGTGASGMHVANAPGLTDPNVDLVSGHFYDDNRMNLTWLAQDAAAARAAGKGYLLGEYDWTDTDNNTAKTRTSTTRAQWHAAIEANGNVSGSFYWAELVDKAVVGTHRDGYELYADAPENSEQTAGRTELARHAAAMTAASSAAGVAPASTGLTGDVSDTFTGTTGAAPDTSKWNVYASSGSSATIQSNALRLLTGTAGGYGDKVAVTSKAAARADQHVTLDFTPAALGEGYFQVTLRGATSDGSIGDVPGYRLEVSNADGSVSVVRRGTSPVSVGTGTTIAGWGAGVTAHLDFSVIGSKITAYAWTGSTKPSTATISGTNTDVTAAGYTGIVLNGGNAAAAVTMTVDTWSLTST